MLDLTNYNLKPIHVPRSKLCTPIWWPDLILKIDDDKEGITLLPPSLFVNLIDVELNKKITKSSEKDPLVLNALQVLEGEVPTQFRSQLSDWSYDAGVLAYQGRVFLLTETISGMTLSNYIMITQQLDTPVTWKLANSSQQATGGLDWPNMLGSM